MTYLLVWKSWRFSPSPSAQPCSASLLRGANRETTLKGMRYVWVEIFLILDYLCRQLFARILPLLSPSRNFHRCAYIVIIHREFFLAIYSTAQTNAKMETLVLQACYREHYLKNTLIRIHRRLTYCGKMLLWPRRTMFEISWFSRG